MGFVVVIVYQKTQIRGLSESCNNGDAAETAQRSYMIFRGESDEQLSCWQATPTRVINLANYTLASIIGGAASFNNGASMRLTTNLTLYPLRAR